MQTDQSALSLFESASPLEIATGKVHRELSRLMRDIAETRATIVRNEEILALLKQRYLKDVVPLETEIGAIRLETLRILGGHLKAGWLKKKAARALTESLIQLADELEEEYGFNLDEERATLLGRRGFTEADAKEIFGDDPPPSPDVFEALKSMFEEIMGEGPGREDESNAGKSHRGAASSQRGSKPNPKSKASLKRAAEEQTLAGDIRALYLLLARALHPDKEPDAARREVKTAWMQKVTDAYGARDLARLLDILSRNPLDALGPYLSTAPLTTVKGFAKRLRRELTTLKNEAGRIFDSNTPDFILSMLGPEGIKESAVRAHINRVKKEIKFLRERNEAYRRRETVMEMVDALRFDDPSGFM